MSTKWKCVCGRESPLTERRCPNCQKPLVYGKYVTDEQEPKIPFRPIVDWEEIEDPEKAPRVTKKKTPKEPKQRKSEKKKREKSGGQAVLILLLLLIILLMGALIIFLLGRIGGPEPAPVQPPVQTTPVDTPADPTLPADTQPVPTDPPATDPPATQPPATDPPATQPVQSVNFLKATIHDEEIIFQLHSAEVASTEIHADYRAYNPRGELRYYLSFQFEKNLGVGTYNTTGSILYSKVNITFQDHAVSRSDYFDNYRRSGDRTEITGTFEIEKMSDDWMTYDGSFNAELVIYGKKDSIVIDDAVFNFTLQ